MARKKEETYLVLPRVPVFKDDVEEVVQIITSIFDRVELRTDNTAFETLQRFALE